MQGSRRAFGAINVILVTPQDRPFAGEAASEFSR